MLGRLKDLVPALSWNLWALLLTQLQKSNVNCERSYGGSSFKDFNNKGPVKIVMGRWVGFNCKTVYLTIPKIPKDSDITQRVSLTTAG